MNMNSNGYTSPTRPRARSTHLTPYPMPFLFSAKTEAPKSRLNSISSSKTTRRYAVRTVVALSLLAIT
jgi:hypothetical protein